jgi:transposase
MLEGPMEAATWSATKEKVLGEQGILNPHPERVNDELFEQHPFFDARDLVQVRYEMVRRVLLEGQPVGKTAAAFGYSRVTLYQLRKRFEAEGMTGLLPRGKGPCRAYKLTDDVVHYLEGTLAREAEVRLVDLPARVEEEFGVRVHGHSIERALARQRKKG